MFKKFKRKLYIFYSTVKIVHKSKFDFVMVAFDLLFCKIYFHITYDEYLKYKFYNFKNRYRKNFVLIHHRKYKYRNIITKEFTKSKYDFYKRLSNLYSRAIIRLPECGEECFLQFVKKHNKFVLKPDVGSLGRDVEIIEYKSDEQIRKIFFDISEEKPIVCEEFINQHNVLQRLNPFSVNTIRIVSIFKEGVVEVLSATLRTGANTNSVVDNLVNGGIGAQVDIETGIVTTFGSDYNFNKYSHHPITGVQIIGMAIPNWDKAIELVKKAHSRVPECLIYGWDIAITKANVELVEANNAPGPRIMQTMDCIPKGEKLIPMFKKKITKHKCSQ